MVTLAPFRCRHQGPCVRAFEDGREVLVLAHPSCPEHGDGEGWWVVGVPPWANGEAGR